jgi:predicted nucleic acid-binding Zn ribbon protein
VTPDRECPACGGAIPSPPGTGRRQGRPRRWCSDACRFMAHGRSDVEMRNLRLERDAINAAFRLKDR